MFALGVQFNGQMQVVDLLKLLFQRRASDALTGATASFEALASKTRTSGREGGELLQLLQLDKVKCGIAPGNGSNDACFSILCRLRNLACHCFCLNTEQSNTYSAGYAASCQVGNVKSSRGKRLLKSRSRPGFRLSQPLCLGYPLHGMCSINKFPTSKSVLGAQCYVIFASFVAGKLSKAIGC